MSLGCNFRFSAAILLVCLLTLSLAHTCPAQEETASGFLEPGIYQLGDEATCEMTPQDDGSWRMILWQGSSLTRTNVGFAYLGRMVPDAAMTRLSGSWQALPGSCCPGRGRGEIEVLSPTGFRFSLFAPDLEQAPWRVLPEAEFTKVADLPLVAETSLMAGDWRLAMWYGDLLPEGAPADPVFGVLSLSSDVTGTQGQWEGHPGVLSFTSQGPGVQLTYNDPAAGYQLSASLTREAGGLSYAGSFNSTLGSGRIRLTRTGLPANPPSPAAEDAGGLSGTWVDPRTGSDFFELKGSAGGFDFQTYGGLKAKPRYLSRGRARPAGPGRFEAQAQDVDGYCCGNQARLIFRVLEPEKLEVSSFWWPKGRKDPGNPPSQPYVIERVKKDAGQAASRIAPTGRWPVVQPIQEGVLAVDSGAVKVDFTWLPQEGAERDYTLFSQGGYLRDFDLFLTKDGRLAAKIAAKDRMIELASERSVMPNEPQTAWLVYLVGDKARLFLGEEQVAEADMTEPWQGSRSPYILGASRWPGRGFSGEIKQVELWKLVQNPQMPDPPDLTIIPPSYVAQAQDAAQASDTAKPNDILRLWHPRKLLHVYAVNQEQAARYKDQGFTLQGAIGGLQPAQLDGLSELWAYKHRARGYMLLSTSSQAPEGCDSLGMLGYIHNQATPDTTPLYELKGAFTEPIRGGESQDVLYTSNRETVAKAQEAGYQNPVVIGYVRATDETEYKPPILYTWAGSWRGEGWGRFFMLRQGGVLHMFWYYGKFNGPHYFGRYRLSPDARRADGVAVGRPGPKATYYNHQMSFDTTAPRGPRVKLSSWRLVAPMDSGQLVRFKKPHPSQTWLYKVSDQIPAQELELMRLKAASAESAPGAMLNQALENARNQGMLIEK